MSDRLRSLEEVTQTILDAELAKLKALADESRARQDQIARLGDALAARATEIRDASAADDLAFRTGQDALWQAWVARSGRKLTREAAEVAARREAQCKRARRALGQVDAVARIRALEEDDRRQRAARRFQSEYGGSEGSR